MLSCKIKAPSSLYLKAQRPTPVFETRASRFGGVNFPVYIHLDTGPYDWDINTTNDIWFPIF